MDEFVMTDDDLLAIVDMWEYQPHPRPNHMHRLLTKTCDELKRRGYIQVSYLEFELPGEEEDEDG